MSSISGIDVLLDVDISTNATPNYQPIGGQRNATLKAETKEIDDTDKLSGGFEKTKMSTRNVTIEHEGSMQAGDEAFSKVYRAWWDKYTINARLTIPGLQTITGTFSVLNIDMGSEHTDNATAKITLKPSSAPTSVWV